MARAERMVENAIKAHKPFDSYRDVINVYTKGSYRNGTNVRLDSDVDVVVEHTGSYFHDFHESVTNPSPTPGWIPYAGPWKADVWRTEVTKALTSYFGGTEVDASGEVAVTIQEKAGSRPSADVVPAHEYWRYDDQHRVLKSKGSKVFKKSGGEVINYPEQQLKHGNTKDSNTGGRYKMFVRALKNAENTLAKESLGEELPSYFMECLVYNVPDQVLRQGYSLSSGFRETIYWLHQHLNDTYRYEDWVEPNELKYLFSAGNKWRVEDGQKLVLGTWTYLGYPVG